MRVYANRLGYYGGVLREPGEEFDIQDEKELGSWMSRVDQDVQRAKPGRKPKDDKQ